MRLFILVSLLLASLLWSSVQVARLWKFGSGKAFMSSSAKAFSLMRRSFVAFWFTCGSAVALTLQWKLLSVGLCFLVGMLAAYGLEVLTKSSGLLSFIQAGEEAMAARHASIRQECAPSTLFLVQANGEELAPKIVPARRDWNALLHVGTGGSRSTAS